jgi:uncharacterized short protein YbdD (DUF466 family)
MRTETEWNAKILNLTMRIMVQYPELSPYIEEMRITIPDVRTPEIECENLATYYDSLQSMLSGYSRMHQYNGNLIHTNR